MGKREENHIYILEEGSRFEIESHGIDSKGLAEKVRTDSEVL